jgi:hypothetical protein
MPEARMTDRYEASAATDVRLLREVLDELEWAPQELESQVAFSVDFGDPHLPVSNALAAIAIPASQFVIYINFGFVVPSALRDEVARLAARANWGLTIGNFELDLDDGHARFKSSIDYTGVSLSKALIRTAILRAMTAVERYSEAFIDVASGRKSALAAISAVEGPPTSEVHREPHPQQ